MAAHNKDYQLIPGQFICFISSAITLIQAIIIGGHVADVLIKFTDALFITGSTLLSVKLARDDDEMPAAGFILLAIGWGVLFASTDFMNQKVGVHIVSSAFYFVLPSMILMTFYKKFKLWLRILLILNIVPFQVSMVLEIFNPESERILYWSYTNILFMHIVSIIWSMFFFIQYKKGKKQTE